MTIWDLWLEVRKERTDGNRQSIFKFSLGSFVASLAVGGYSQPSDGLGWFLAYIFGSLLNFPFALKCKFEKFQTSSLLT